MTVSIMDRMFEEIVGTLAPGPGPGPGPAAALAVVDVGGLDAEATVCFAAACRRQQAWTEARGLDAAAHLVVLRGEVAGSPGAGR